MLMGLWACSGCEIGGGFSLAIGGYLAKASVVTVSVGIQHIILVKLNYPSEPKTPTVHMGKKRWL
jgi:hypothetical protein